jgi:glycosyltransferase involved in cell wall biosynthesis
MKKLLVMTLLDYREKPNNRIQHTVNALISEFDEVWLLCRCQPFTGGLLAKIKNILPLPVTYCIEGKLHILEYNPPFNYLGTYLAIGENHEGFGQLKSFINFVGVVREFLFSLVILYVTVRYLKGSFFLCIVETSWEGIVAIFLKKIGKIKYLVFDDNDFNPSFMRSKLRRKYTIFMEKYCIMSADLVIAVGHLLAEFWRKDTGKEILVIPNGVDTKKFRGIERSNKGESTSLVYVGTLSSSWVDMNLILKSLKVLLESKFIISLTVVGTANKSYIKSLQTRIRKDQLTEHIKILEAVKHDELPDILRQCDIGLAVSPANLLRHFAFPLKVVEYMAMGLPVVGNKETETEWIIEHYKAGISIDPVVEELCVALSRLIEDQSYYTQCRSNAVLGAQDFDLERLASLRRNEMVRRFF